VTCLWQMKEVLDDTPASKEMKGRSRRDVSKTKEIWKKTRRYYGRHGSKRLRKDKKFHEILRFIRGHVIREQRVCGL
jgi:hypothetical protein